MAQKRRWHPARSEAVRSFAATASARKQAFQRQFRYPPEEGLLRRRQSWLDHIVRNADVHVFAWHLVANHRDPMQWEFFVVPEASLSGEGKTISLSQIRKLAEPVNADRLNEVVGQHLKGKSIAAE